jgi:lipoprotein-anchoring transpeptidase ErfK/SrfK
MVRVSGHKAAVAGRLWRIAVLAAAGAIGSTAEAEAALYYWSDSDAGYYRPQQAMPQQRQKPRRHQARKIEAPAKEATKPQGPLVIAISIERQSLKIYDANGFFAETPISTGMKGHSTPMGVFSVIQKHKLHHSNIYSGAPMPYMQRITWSGVAMHAGVLPGYPASHGCIRMPMAFAMKMWNWTKMGARVVVTPGEMTPASFSHPLLAALKVAPQPAAEPQADAPPAPKSDKASEADTPVKPAISAASLELRSTLGHADDAKPTVGQASASLRERTHTADAGGDMPSTLPSATMSDAAASGGNRSMREESETTTVAPLADDTAAAKAADPVQPDAKPETASSDVKPTETIAADAASDKTDEHAVVTPSSDEAAKAEISATGSTKAEENTAEKRTEAKADESRAEEAKAEAAKPDAPKSSDKAGDAAKEMTKETTKATTDATAGAADAKKDQARLPDPVKPAAAKTDQAAAAAPKRAGQIAVFISRKDSKLYVRQNFAPLFDAPVTVAPSDRPLGTHVFTAEIDKNDANLVRWSVVTLPAPRHAERRDEDERASRRRKIAGAVAEAKPLPQPDSPADALDRLSIPADVMARITDALTTGASIIVSDQGINGGETGEGTDFIVSLR